MNKYLEVFLVSLVISAIFSAVEYFVGINAVIVSGISSIIVILFVMNHD